MIHYLLSYVQGLVKFSVDLLPWLFVGLAIAGLVEEFIPIRHFVKYFGTNDWKAVARASLAGLFVSVCSCGAIPLVVTLRRKGSTTANALTFLLATPWVGPIHLLILYKFVGLGLTVIFFAFSILIAFSSGLILAKLETRNVIEGGISRKVIAACELEAEKRHSEEPLRRRVFICSATNSWDVFRDVGKYVLAGILVAAALTTFVSPKAIADFLGSQSRYYPIFLAVPVSAVIELCSEGFTILAGQLYTMGASAGVIFTMLLVGVTTDFTEISMIWGKFGKRSALAYLVVSTVLVVLFAYFINLIWYGRV